MMVEIQETKTSRNKLHSQSTNNLSKTFKCLIIVSYNKFLRKTQAKKNLHIAVRISRQLKVWFDQKYRISIGSNNRLKQVKKRLI
jgi:hypothetical protein